MKPSVYLIPGRHDPLDGLLGQSLLDLDQSFWGRELNAPFTALDFAGQLAAIHEDLDGCQARTLIGDSYGAYLLLHALAGRAPHPGRVLLFSPVLGEGRAVSGLYLSRPPRAARLLALAEAGQFPVPAGLQIHTGEEDPGCDPRLAEHFVAGLPDAGLWVYPGQGHRLEKTLIRTILADFLAGR